MAAGSSGGGDVRLSVTTLVLVVLITGGYGFVGWRLSFSGELVYQLRQSYL